MSQKSSVTQSDHFVRQVRGGHRSLGQGRDGNGRQRRMMSVSIVLFCVADFVRSSIDSFLRCADRALRDLVAVGAGPGARTVVLHRVGPAGSWTSGCRNGVDGGERKRESQGNLGQHGHSPRMEARGEFVGRFGIVCARR
jgi:hypothetical protein